MLHVVYRKGFRSFSDQRPTPENGHYLFGTISRESLNRLNDLPKLRLIKFGRSLRPRTGPSDPARRVETYQNGYFIRSYVSESHEHQLVHLRRCSQLYMMTRNGLDAASCAHYDIHPIIEGGEDFWGVLLDDDYHWHDETDYGGRCVPADVLKKVYEAADMDMEWLEGGRDLKLPEGAWQILEEWYKEDGDTVTQTDDM
jgi:hypothetical protein